MKTLIAVVIAVVVSGCADNSSPAYFPEMPEGLKDCKVYNVQSDDKAKTLHIVRCPNSSTSTTHQNGRDRIHNTVIEDKVKVNQLVVERI